MINGVRYPLRSVEDPAYVHALASEMDGALRKIMGEANLSFSEALVLLGMEYIDCYKKAEKNLDNMRNQVAEYMEAVKRAGQELGEAKRELGEAKRELGEAKRELGVAKEEIELLNALIEEK